MFTIILFHHLFPNLFPNEMVLSSYFGLGNFYRWNFYVKKFYVCHVKTYVFVRGQNDKFSFSTIIKNTSLWKKHFIKIIGFINAPVCAWC